MIYLGQRTRLNNRPSSRGRLACNAGGKGLLDGEDVPAHLLDPVAIDFLNSGRRADQDGGH